MRPEDHLRAALSSRLSNVRASDDAWTSIETRLDQSSAPALRRRIGIAAFALLLSLAGFLGIWIAFNGTIPPPHPPVTEPAPTPSRAPAVTGTFPLAEPALLSSIAYGEGSVWVSIANGPKSGHTILRMDPLHGDTLARISVPVVPHWQTGGGGLSIADGAVWLAGSAVGGGRLAEVLRIDPATNHVAQVVTVDGEDAADVAESGGIVWLLIRGDGSMPTLYRVDAGTGRIDATIPLPGAYGRSVVVVDGSVFVSIATSSAEQGGGVGGTTIVRIDPVANTITDRQDFPSGAALAAGDGEAWLATGMDLVRLDPKDGTPATTYRVANSGDAIAVGDGGVWFFERSTRRLARLDLATNDVTTAQQDEGGDRIAMAVGPGSAWAVGWDGVVTRVQMVPDCPAVAPGVYDPSISPAFGPAGTDVRITGRVPMYSEDGAYVPPSGTLQIWWNVRGEGIEWETLLPGGDDPTPALPGEVVKVAEILIPDACSYEARFEVPAVPPGSYPLTLISSDSESATSLGGGLMFHVEG
jgi:streptogramin lyase